MPVPDRHPQDAVIGTQNVHGIMAPDYAIIRLRNGLCLMVGDEGINVCASEADMRAGIVIDGLTFGSQKFGEVVFTKPASAQGASARETRLHALEREIGRLNALATDLRQIIETLNRTRLRPS